VVSILRKSGTRKLPIVSCNLTFTVVWPEARPVVEDMKPLSKGVKQSRGAHIIWQYRENWPMLDMWQKSKVGNG